MTPSTRARDVHGASAYAEGMPAQRKKLPVEVLYPESDDMGEHVLHRLITDLFRQLLARLFAQRGSVAFVGANQFIYWVQGNPTIRVAPDSYVLPGVRPDATFGSWKIWQDRIVPSFVLEIASEGYSKDYEDNPAIYGRLGVQELVIFDPRAKPGSRSRRVRWQVYRRLPGRGLTRVEVSQSDRVRSKVLRAWLRACGEGADLRIRLGLGPQGDELVPTEGEAERAEKERERTEKEREREQRQRAEAEVVRLRALLARKKRVPKPAAASATRRRT
jgi:hypothetical protein